MKTADLIDVIRVLHNLDSDGKAGKLINATRQEVSNWRKGYQQPTAYHRNRIAEATDMKLEEIDAIIELQKEKNPERREYWNRLLSGAAIVILSVAAGMGLVQIDSSTTSFMGIILSANEGAVIDIMRSHNAALFVMAYFLYWIYFQQKQNGNLTHDISRNLQQQY